MRTTLFSVAAGIVLGLTSGTVSAHHAFNSEFDANKPVKVQGTVSKVDWINPHAWIHIDVKKPDGTVEKWMFEAGTPNTLMRRGLTKNSVAIGTEVIADGYQSKDGICEPACRANGRDLRLPDGRILLLGADGGAARQ
ncbi:MAG: hypothetical protein HYU37_02795 [Acidobacteria bacterium]|nr:hypothetical protein [Acidobacteriota bacterium]